LPEAAGLHYEVHGPADAPPVILSSGLGGAGAYWAPNLTALAERFRLVTYDHRGTGKSERHLGPTSVEAMGVDVIALMDALEIESAQFVGHALGAMIGIEASRQSGRIARLVAINAWRTLSPHTRRCFEARLELLRSAGVEAFVGAQPLFLYPPDWIANHDAQLAEELPHHIAAFPGAETMEARIAAVQAWSPSLEMLAAVPAMMVIATKDDFLVPFSAARQLGASLHDARIETFAWGGHACNVTDPDHFNHLVLDFLRS